MPVMCPKTIAVIFCAQRSGTDATGYASAAEAMDRLAAEQPGYIGMDHARTADGFGITVSYWVDDQAAKAWRDDPQHTAIREAGRDRWYDSYSLHVAEVTRSYDWERRP